VKWVFKDGTELEVKLEAHSVRLSPFVPSPFSVCFISISVELQKN
jgi:hypothetical protein